jgi:hypothetical protein
MLVVAKELKLLPEKFRISKALPLNSQSMLSIPMGDKARYE